MLWSKAIDGIATRVNLVAVVEKKKECDNSNLIMPWVKTKMRDFYSFKKAYEKSKKSHFLVSLISEINLTPMLHRHSSKHIFPKTLIKLEVSALNFLHTAFQKSLLVELFKTKDLKHLHFSKIFFFLACSHLSKSPNQILHQLMSCFVNSIHPRRSQWVHASLISHISDNISQRMSCRAYPVRNRHYSCFSSSIAVTSSKSVLFHNVNPKAEPFTSAIHRDWRP